MGAPALYVNGGIQTYPLNADSTAAAVTGRWATDPGFLVDVAADPAAGASVPVTVTLTPLVDRDLAGTVLFVALYENLITYASAPGNNGQTVFHHMFRDRIDVPPALGALTTGNRWCTSSLNRGSADPANVTVVAFVQRVADRVVLQAGSNRPEVPSAAELGGAR